MWGGRQAYDTFCWAWTHFISVSRAFGKPVDVIVATRVMMTFSSLLCATTVKWFIMVSAPFFHHHLLKSKMQKIPHVVWAYFKDTAVLTNYQFSHSWSLRNDEIASPGSVGEPNRQPPKAPDEKRPPKFLPIKIFLYQ